MATNFWSGDSTPLKIVGEIKQAILRSSDWAHLQLSTGTAATTLSSGASIGATSISTAATIPSGSTITIWRSGTANSTTTLESRVTTGVSGSGPYTVTFTDPLVNAYNSSDAVGVGSYVKCTTTRGAQMVVDLADSAATAVKMNLAVYRTHDGTTAVDKVTRYINVRTSGGATSDSWHARVSAGKEHLYIDVEGPRAGETNASSSTTGSWRQNFFLGDIVPYFAGDTTPAVVLVANSTSASVNIDPTVIVSRNQSNTSSWVTAHLTTLQPPAMSYNSTSISWSVVGVQRAATGDSKTYIFPYVIFETADGLRGRIGTAFYTGLSAPSLSGIGDILPSLFSRVTYDSKTYILIPPDKNTGGTGVGSQFGRVATSSSGLESAVVAIPYS